MRFGRSGLGIDSAGSRCCRRLRRCCSALFPGRRSCSNSLLCPQGSTYPSCRHRRRRCFHGETCWEGNWSGTRNFPRIRTRCSPCCCHRTGPAGTPCDSTCRCCSWCPNSSGQADRPARSRSGCSGRSCMPHSRRRRSSSLQRRPIRRLSGRLGHVPLQDWVLGMQACHTGRAWVAGEATGRAVATRGRIGWIRATVAAVTTRFDAPVVSARVAASVKTAAAVVDASAILASRVGVLLRPAGHAARTAKIHVIVGHTGSVAMALP